MTSAHAYELPPHTSTPAEAVEAAEHGPDIPMSEVWADYADILGPYPDAQTR